MIRVVGMSGSLRAQSSNTEALLAAARIAPDDIDVELYSALGTLPHFNPDLDREGMMPPPSVADLRSLLGNSDALLVSTPEYAHGVPGTLKNALDWLVRDWGVLHMPVAILNISPRSRHAPASLAETLRTMSMSVVPAHQTTLVARPERPRTTDLTRDPDFVATIRRTFDALVDRVRTRPLHHRSHSS